MKKVVRLTESDLVRLVNKVLLEQNNGLQKLKSPLQIKLGYGQTLVDVTEIKKNNYGCDFKYVKRDGKDGYEFSLQCKGNAFIQYKQPMEDGALSEKAKSMLRQACGCDSYVSNSSDTSSLTSV